MSLFFSNFLCKNVFSSELARVGPRESDVTLTVFHLIFGPSPVLLDLLDPSCDAATSKPFRNDFGASQG